MCNILFTQGKAFCADCTSTENKLGTNALIKQLTRTDLLVLAPGGIYKHTKIKLTILQWALVLPLLQFQIRHPQFP